MKFNFLVPGDPYHAYYQHKVRAVQSRPSRIRLTRVLHDRLLPSRRTTRALRESRWRYGAPYQLRAPAGLTRRTRARRLQRGLPLVQRRRLSALPCRRRQTSSPSSSKRPKRCAALRRRSPARPLTHSGVQEQYTIALLDGIAAFDLDVIKLTAQFVARNGKSFLTGLTSREHMNPQVRACAAVAWRVSSRLTRALCAVCVRSSTS